MLKSLNKPRRDTVSAIKKPFEKVYAENKVYNVPTNEAKDIEFPSLYCTKNY